MRKICILAFVLLTLTLSASAQLKFDSNKKFKIVQFTDLHYIDGDKRSDVVFECFDNVIKTEKPNLIVVTGDLIYSRPGVDKFDVVMKKLDSYGVPFVVTFGNHDREMGATNEELFAVAQKYKNFAGKSAKGVSGVGNDDAVVLSNDGKREEAVLYCFDSHRGVAIDGMKGYDYIKRDQIEWYIKQSGAHTKKNAGKTLISLAFFHIPLLEYTQALTMKKDTLYGVYKEKPCPSELNSGLFTAFKEQGDIRGIFVGHDHDNDFATPFLGVLLAYGRFSGGPTEYFNLDMNGARVIELTEGEKQFETWIRLRDGRELQRVKF